MPTTCIVSKCNSGYKTNLDQVSFFLVPKDKQIMELWEKIIDRKDLKDHHRICEKHFLPSDIIWERKIFSPDGKLAGSIRYKRPSLSEKATPRLDSFEPEKVNKQNSCSPNHIDIVTPIEILPPPLEVLQLSIQSFHTNRNVRNVDKLDNKSTITYFQARYKKPVLSEKVTPRLHSIESKKVNEQNSYAPNHIDIATPIETLQPSLEVLQPSVQSLQTDCDVSQESQEISNDTTNISNDVMNVENTFSFNQILNSSLQLPPNWSNNSFNHENMSVIVFSKLVLRNVHGSLGVITEKEVLINQNLELHINVYHQLVKIDLLKINKSVKSVSELQNILFLIESLSVCRGCTVSSELQEIKSKVTFCDCTNTLRHKNCHLLINSVQCRCCYQGKRTLARKKMRQKNQPKAKKIRVQLPKEVKEHLQTKNKQLKNTEIKNKRLKAANMKLKQHLLVQLDHKKKLKRYQEGKPGSSKLEQLLRNSNLPEHHHTV